jgi:hypothetical protein
MPIIGVRAKRRAGQSILRDAVRPARVSAQALDALVWQDLCDVLTHPDSLAQALERAQAGAWLPQERPGPACPTAAGNPACRASG